ncbi:MAG: iron-sulfur cluster assembly protein IscA [Methylotetracoccus sp.]|jgi:iron-sulfur cluster assembly protein|nr:iron-sulfur cluster assembly protein IscA [Methylotetracoccus sp.]
MSLSLTESAARQISKQLARRGKGLGLRLGVRKSGCSGFAYVVDYADDVTPDDAVFEQHGVKVVVRNQDLSFLNGIEVDYTREGINEAFRFNNPNVKASCGCGESFAV